MIIRSSNLLLVLSILAATSACSRGTTCAVEGCDKDKVTASAAAPAAGGSSSDAKVQADSDKVLDEKIKKITDRVSLLEVLTQLHDKAIALQTSRVDAIEASNKTSADIAAALALRVGGNEAAIRAADLKLESLYKDLADKLQIQVDKEAADKLEIQGQIIALEGRLETNLADAVADLTLADQDLLNDLLEKLQIEADRVDSLDQKAREDALLAYKDLQKNFETQLNAKAKELRAEGAAAVRIGLEAYALLTSRIDKIQAAGHVTALALAKEIKTRKSEVVRLETLSADNKAALELKISNAKTALEKLGLKAYSDLKGDIGALRVQLKAQVDKEAADKLEIQGQMSDLKSSLSADLTRAVADLETTDQAVVTQLMEKIQFEADRLDKVDVAIRAEAIVSYNSLVGQLNAKISGLRSEGAEIVKKGLLAHQALTARIDEIQSSAATTALGLAEEITARTNDISTLVTADSTNKSLLEGQIAAAESRLTSLGTTAYNELKGDIAASNARILALESAKNVSVTAFEAYKLEVTSAKNLINTAIDEIKGKIALLEADVDSKLSSADAKIYVDQLNESLKLVRDDAALLSAEVDGHGVSIQTLLSFMAAVETSGGAEDIAKIDQLVKDMNAEKKRVSDRLDAFNSVISTIKKIFRI